MPCIGLPENTDLNSRGQSRTVPLLKLSLSDSVTMLVHQVHSRDENLLIISEVGEQGLCYMRRAAFLVPGPDLRCAIMVVWQSCSEWEGLPMYMLVGPPDTVPGARWEKIATLQRSRVQYVPRTMAANRLKEQEGQMGCQKLTETPFECKLLDSNSIHRDRN